MTRSPGGVHRDVRDVVIVGGGIAGMSAALAAVRDDTDARITLLTKESLEESATKYAQGGVAAALELSDTPDLHLEDTIRTGDGLCDEQAVRVLVEEGPDRVVELLEWGTPFDRTRTGELALTREGGHSRARILHAGGDATGAEMQRSMGDLVQQERIQLVQDMRAEELVVEDGVCAGIGAVGPSGERVELRAHATVLATGGAGGMFHVTTNPDIATADGLGMAIVAGAVVGDMEFMQFHPTALATAARPRPLVSEAVRGEGGVLRTPDGERLMEGRHPMGDLAPRDVVSRSVHGVMEQTGSDHVWLDATAVPDFPGRFPTITSFLAGYGIDPTTDWIPVAPAAHYYCGGVATDLHGRTSVPGLYACGEVATVGVHGANRLASNSLLDGLVFGNRVGLCLGESPRPADLGLDSIVSRFDGPLVGGPAPDGRGSDAAVVESVAELRRAMTRHAGVVRSRGSLDQVRLDITRLAPSVVGDRSARHLAITADALAVAALTREETRGCHSREDFPKRDERWSHRLFQRRDVHAGTVEVLR